MGELDRVVKVEGVLDFIKAVKSTRKALHYILGAGHNLFFDIEARRYGIVQKIGNWMETHE